MFTIELNQLSEKMGKNIRVREIAPIAVDWETLPDYILFRGRLFFRNTSYYAPADPSIVEYLELKNRSIVDVSGIVPVEENHEF